MIDVMDQVVYLLGIPLPPTENSIYATFKGRRISSKSLRDFQRAVRDWRFENLHQCRQAMAKCQNWVNQGHYLRVNARIFFLKEKLFCQDGRVKSLDTSNRIKALHDSLSQQILLIDDRYFFELSIAKSVGMKEEVNIWIEPIYKASETISV